MDSEHRHELKTNELAEWVAHFPDFCRRNFRTLIGVGLIAAAVVVYVWGKHIRSESHFRRQAEAVSLIEQFDFSKLRVVGALGQNADTGDAIMIAANRLQMAVDETKAPQVSALLLIKHGEALRSDLHYRPAELDEEIAAQRIKEARQAYERALSLAKGNPTLVAMARFGIGLCAEEVGDYIEAEEIYNRIIAEQDFAATVFPVQAQQRLDNMQENRRRFVFADVPVLRPEPGMTMPPLTIPGGEEVMIVGQEPPQLPSDEPVSGTDVLPGGSSEEETDEAGDAPPMTEQADESPDMN